MGFDKKGDGVRLSPRAPAGWEEVTLLYRFGGSRYQLTARRDAPYITLDGEKMTGAYVPLRDDGRAHEIRFPMPPANE
jgi:cellobiose phosphorylase